MMDGFVVALIVIGVLALLGAIAIVISTFM